MPDRSQTDITERFDRDGYVVIEAALDSHEVEALCEEARLICRSERGPVRGLEPPAPGESDESVYRRCTCIHFPHRFRR